MSICTDLYTYVPTANCRYQKHSDSAEGLLPCAYSLQPVLPAPVALGALDQHHDECSVQCHSSARDAGAAEAVNTQQHREGAHLRGAVSCDDGFASDLKVLLEASTRSLATWDDVTGSTTYDMPALRLLHLHLLSPHYPAGKLQQYQQPPRYGGSGSRTTSAARRCGRTGVPGVAGTGIKQGAQHHAVLVAVLTSTHACNVQAICTILVAESTAHA